MNHNSGVPNCSSKICLKKMEITKVKIFCCLFSICAYICDVAFDIFVAVRHYKNENEAYFVLTMLFIILPALIVTATSIWWYIVDHLDPHQSVAFRVSPTQWVIRIIFLTLLMAPVLRSLEALYYAKKSAKSQRKVEKENYARKMIFENTDASLLRLFEACLECAPQLILQIYILAHTYSRKLSDISKTEIIQLISIFTSLVSMTFAIISYLRSLRESLDTKKELNFFMTIFLFLWRLFEITARVVALGLFASVLLPYFFLFSVAHYFVMFVWIRTIKTDFCQNNEETIPEQLKRNNWLAELVYNFVLSFMFIFCFINPKDDKAQVRHVLYYSLVGVENTVLISVWYHYSLSSFKLPVLIIVFVCISLAIILMTFYYVFVHPTRGTFFKRSSQENRSVSVSGSHIIASRFKSNNREFLDTAEDKEMVEPVQSAVELIGKSVHMNGMDEQRAED